MSPLRKWLLIGILFASSMAVWVFALLSYDDPPQTPKRPEYVRACIVSGLLLLGAMSCLAVPPSRLIADASSTAQVTLPPVRTRDTARWVKMRLCQQWSDSSSRLRFPDYCCCCGGPLAARVPLTVRKPVLAYVLPGVMKLIASDFLKYERDYVGMCFSCYSFWLRKSLTRNLLVVPPLVIGVFLICSALFQNQPVASTAIAAASILILGLLAYWVFYRGWRATHACTGPEPAVRRVREHSARDRGTNVLLSVLCFEACSARFVKDTIALNRSTAHVEWDAVALEGLTARTQQPDHH